MNKSRTSSVQHKSSGDEEKAQLKKLLEVKEKIRISFNPAPTEEKTEYIKGL